MRKKETILDRDFGYEIWGLHISYITRNIRIQARVLHDVEILLMLGSRDVLMWEPREHCTTPRYVEETCARSRATGSAFHGPTIYQKEAARFAATRSPK